MHPPRRRTMLSLLGAPLLSAPMLGCALPQVHVATLASLSGPFSDVGVAVRDGAQFALERNPPRRLRVHLHEFDHAMLLQALPGIAQRMAALGVVAVVGPAISTMARAWLPLAQHYGLLTISPTATSHELSGLNDVFFRVCASNYAYARGAAEFVVQRLHWRRMALLRDDSNPAYTHSWGHFFAQRAHALGASVVAELAFRHPATTPELLPLLRQAWAAQPDALVLIASASDCAALAQLAARYAPYRPAMLAAEWASTPMLIERGGRTVEGMLVSQFFDPSHPGARFQRFAQQVLQRFGHKPGFGETTGYDAMHVLLQALQQRRSHEPLRATLLRLRRFEGLQEPIVFNDSGEHDRPQVMTEIRSARFVALDA